MPANQFRCVGEIQYHGRTFRGDESDIFRVAGQFKAEGLARASNRGYNGTANPDEFVPSDKCRHCRYNTDGTEAGCEYEGNPEITIRRIEKGVKRRHSCIIDEALVEIMVGSGDLDPYELKHAS